MTTVERTWECKCGEVKAKLTGEPFLNLLCHCHSCVAGAKFIEEKTNKSGTPLLHPDGGGVCASPYSAGQVEFLTALSDADGKSKLKFVRVGEKGKAGRCYTTCCGTQMTNFLLFPKLVVFNRNGIKNADGTPYEPEGAMLNIMKGKAFDPSTVPEPSHDSTPPHFMLKFMSVILNPFGAKLVEKELNPDDSEVDVVPITWEE